MIDSSFCKVADVASYVPEYMYVLKVFSFSSFVNKTAYLQHASGWVILCIQYTWSLVFISSLEWLWATVWGHQIIA